jgi:prepilin-type N-terminal cleavage/methylation domain-containing protein
MRPCQATPEYAPGRRAGGRPRRGGMAFTLIELLLVIVIISVVSAVTVPSFVRSMRGNQRRGAARMVVSAGRYARSMAVLTQKPMALVFDIAGGRIRVESRGRVAPPAEDATAEAPPTAAASAFDPSVPAGLPPDADGAAARPSTASLALERRLEGISIAFVAIDGEREETGSPTIVYRANGRCTPYRVRLADNRGWAIAIDVDALSTAQIKDEATP